MINTSLDPTISLTSDAYSLTSTNSVFCQGDSITFTASSTSAISTFTFSVGGITYQNSSTNIFEPHNFKQLIGHKLDIVSGLYLCQKTPGIYDIPQEYACVDENGKRFNRFEYEGTRELKEVRANGMGWMLVKKGVFEKIKNPFYSDEGLGHMGEDIVFQLKAKEQGFKSLVDTSVVVGHEKTYILR